VSFSEIDRVDEELNWFDGLLDAIRDGRTAAAIESILDAKQELRKYRQHLIGDDLDERTDYKNYVSLSQIEASCPSLKELLNKYLHAEKVVLERKLGRTIDSVNQSWPQ
jgi:hypothetical protein